MQLNSSLAQVNIPNGVTYHKTSDTNNNDAKKLIIKSIESKESKLIFESTVMIGPNLWQKYLNSKYAQVNIGIELNFKIPIGKEIITRKGRIIKKRDEFKSLWEFISVELSGGNLRVPKEAELEYYWSIIAYEIEEPIFVMENKKNKILFNLTPNENKLVFLESL
jgi:hypothetical protein